MKTTQRRQTNAFHELHVYVQIFSSKYVLLKLSYTNTRKYMHAATPPSPFLTDEEYTKTPHKVLRPL
jgi:hypothetical protein